MCYSFGMSINILYFASLREEIGRSNDVLDYSESLDIAQLWTKTTGQDDIPENLLIALNQEYTSPETLLKDGDEVAFFPPVTGG